MPSEVETAWLVTKCLGNYVMAERGFGVAKILFLYEFGANLGHLSLLIPLAKELVGRHRIIFVVPDPSLAVPHLQRAFDGAVSLRRGPEWQPLADRIARFGTDSHSLADPFNLFGLDEPDRLRAAVEHWCTVWREEAPALVVADFAPVARLALQGKVPMVVVGTGYTVPPPGEMLRPIRPWTSTVPPTSRAREGRLLSAVNHLRAETGEGAIDHLADLFQGDHTFACTLPEFDPYRAYRKGPTTWPYTIPMFSGLATPQSRTGPEIFAYLQAHHPALDPVLRALDALGRPSQIYISGVDPHLIAARCRPHVGIHARPADLIGLLPRAKLVIHHGGIGTACMGFAAGTPQLLLPTRLEDFIIGRGLEETRVAINLPSDPPPTAEAISAAILRLLTEPAFSEAAIGAATRCAHMRSSDPLANIMAACGQFLPLGPYSS